MGSKRLTVTALFACLVPLQLGAVQVQIGITIPFVYIQVGHGLFSSFGLFGRPAALVDEVTFATPAGSIPGDGTVVTGSPVIPVAVLGYSGGGRARYIVTMNSSSGLSNGAGDTIPFDEISWTTRDGDIPGGRFDNSASQTLMSANYNWPRGRGVIDYLTFRYDNDTVYRAGTYTGRVVYTIALL